MAGTAFRRTSIFSGRATVGTRPQCPHTNFNTFRRMAIFVRLADDYALDPHLV